MQNRNADIILINMVNIAGYLF